MKLINNILGKNKIKIIVRTSKGRKATRQEMPNYIIDQKAYLNGILKAEIPNSEHVTVKYRDIKLTVKSW